MRGGHRLAMALWDRVGPYERQCGASGGKDRRKHCWTNIEKDDGRDEIRDDLAETTRVEPISRPSPHRKRQVSNS